MTLYCATTNPGKLREFRQILQSRGFDLQVLPNLDQLEPPEETGATFEENAALKAAYYGAHAPGLLFVDDSGIAVDALDGAPGVHSARYAGDAGDEANNRLLLERMRGVAGRRARFVCVIALADRGVPLANFRGEVEGELLDAPRGPNGFGYDPLFYYPPFGCSFGEADSERKKTVSHRARALEKMVRWIEERR